MRKVLFNICAGIILILIFLCFGGCQKEKKGTRTDEKTDKEKIRVTVSILPQKYFVQRIAGDRAVINVLIPPGHNPATYEPTPQQMKDLGNSQIYFRIGHIAFEKAWMGNIKAANKNMKIVDTSKGVQLIESTPHNEVEAHQGELPNRNEEKSHDHTGVDPHIWLSPRAVKVQAKHILETFLECDPENIIFYENNYRNFSRDIDRLNEEIKTTLKHSQGEKFMVFHPAWGYLARDFNLVQIAIEVEGKDPNPADLKRVIDIAREEGIRAIFVQKQFATHTAEAVADEIGGKVILMDPLAPDWLSNMKKIIVTLKEAL